MDDMISRAEAVRLLTETFDKMAARLDGYGMKSDAHSARCDLELAVKLIGMARTVKPEVAA